MDLFGLRCFVEVVRQGGFSKAAFVLFRTQPAVSQQVRKLEQELGRALLDRSRRAVRLTEAGRALYESARELLERVEGLGGVVADSTAAPSGTLTVASNASLIAHFLPEILKRFHDRYAQVRLKLLNLTSRAIVNAVVEGEAEVGLGFLLKDGPRLESRRVASTELVLVCPPGSAWARRRLKSLEAVLEGPLVHFEEGVGLRRHLEQELRGGASLEPALELPTMEAILTYVRAGLGNSILPEFALAGCRQGELSVRRLSRWLAPIQIRACWRKKRILSRAAEKLLEMLPAL